MTGTIEETRNKEWLQLLELTKRNYGEDKAEFIREKDYLKRNNMSVFQYYKTSYPDIGSQPLSLSELLKNQVFLTKVLGSSEENIKNFADIYNETDSLMKSLNTSEDNIYIKCKPVDDNGNVVEESNNLIGTNVSVLNSMFGELGTSFNPIFLYSSIGLQTFISVVLFIIIYYIGKYMFLDYPKKVISKKM
jgi:hypothetical protein